MAALFTVMPSPFCVVCTDQVREHLTRCHVAPYQCQRCHATFPDALSLNQHSKAAQACEVRDQSDPLFLNKEQEDLLKKRSTRQKSEEQKWRELYTNLFPDDQSSLVPSPYYNDNPILECHEFIKGQVPNGLAEKLKPMGLSPEILSKITAAVIQVADEAFHQFHQSHLESLKQPHATASNATASSPSNFSVQTPDSRSDGDFVDADPVKFVQTWNDHNSAAVPLSPVLETRMSPDPMAELTQTTDHIDEITAPPQINLEAHGGYMISPPTGQSLSNTSSATKTSPSLAFHPNAQCHQQQYFPSSQYSREKYFQAQPPSFSGKPHGNYTSFASPHHTHCQGHHRCGTPSYQVPLQMTHGWMSSPALVRSSSQYANLPFNQNQYQQDPGGMLLSGQTPGGITFGSSGQTADTEMQDFSTTWNIQ